jgi:hypothetical protein
MTLLESHSNGRSSKWKTMLNYVRKKGTSKNRGGSYLALFRPLQDVQSRLILFCGILLAVAAGAPLPIIGVIFARIIDAFPPTEDEIHQRISQLLGVGKFWTSELCYLTDTESNCILCNHVGMGFVLGHCRSSYIQRSADSNGGQSIGNGSNLL